MNLKILAIDTSGSAGSVALTQDETVLAEYSLLSRETHSRRLLQAVDYLLARAGISLKEIDCLAMTLGPGSFTGIRIGLATIKGLAQSLRKPAIGISTLDALSANFPFASRPVLPIIDARRKQVFTATYRPDDKGRLKKVSPERVVSPDALAAAIKEEVILAGDGAALYRDLFQTELGENAVFAPGPLSFIRASCVAYLALERYRAGKMDDVASMTPVYVRPSEAELKDMITKAQRDEGFHI
ncbi:MAG: tRNA (adenosine(37)-N6)-threonylcarbamoyltransferase complex dimerization subunit type 1 TsaB [Pseudomonadota bacterium]